MVIVQICEHILLFPQMLYSDFLLSFFFFTFCLPFNLYVHSANDTKFLLILCVRCWQMRKSNHYPRILLSRRKTDNIKIKELIYIAWPTLVK